VQGALMVCGTSSGVGRTVLATGLCRALARNGVRVAPFNAQVVTGETTVAADGTEVAQSLAHEAEASRVVSEGAMNPLLLKPRPDGAFDAYLSGVRWQTIDVAAYQAFRPAFDETAAAALETLRRRTDVVVCDGASGPSGRSFLGGEADHFDLAVRAEVPVVVVGNVARGNVFTNLFDFWERVGDAGRRRIVGFVVNQHRGDRHRLEDAIDKLTRSTGLPTFGVLAHQFGVTVDRAEAMKEATYDDTWAEDPLETDSDGVTVSVIRLPHMAQIGDLHPLRLEPAVQMRMVDRPREIAHADLVILPGTTAVAADLAWLRERGFVEMLEGRRRAGSPAVVLGIGGGYQMLGRRIEDPEGVEGASTEGLGWLDVVTTFGPEVRAARCSGIDPAGRHVRGFALHRGRVERAPGSPPLFTLDGGSPEGARDDAAGVYGTLVHGLFDADEARADLLHIAAVRRGRDWRPSHLSYPAEREAQYDRLADACEYFLDLPALWVAAGLAVPEAASTG
jgi:adenosylcobyric acid synthase